MRQQPVGHALPGMFRDFLTGPAPAWMMDGAPSGPLVDMVKSMPALNQAALATAPIPVLGDLVGLAADARMYAQEPESRTAGNFGLSALGLLPFMPGMTVFHGTPHRFAPEPDAPLGKFRLDKIGTGEGAQAYGHGIYVAESPDVAGSYKVNLTRNRSGMMSLTDENQALRVGDRPLLEVADIEADAEFIRYVAEEKNAAAAFHAVERLERWRELSADPTYQFREYAAEKAKAWERIIPEVEAGKVTHARTGSLYSVDLPDSEIAKMLDWDAPLSEQPEALSAVKGMALYDEGARREADTLIARMDALAKNRHPVTNRMVDEASWHQLARQRDKLLEGLPPKPFEEMTGGQFHDWMTGNGANAAVQADVAEKLRQAGIPGIRYLDGNSRNAKDGTRNFVIFDPEVAKIIDRK